MYNIHTFDNGLRVVHFESNLPVSHCAVMVGVGSRDENPDEVGIAHLIEHMFFKGTQKRKPYHIFSRIEDVGGDINAYTTKEETCIYSAFLSQYYERAIELFSDILFNSMFPDKALITEKDVIYEEIGSYKDSPSEQIFDDFDELVFDGHPLGNNILGNKKSLSKLTREHILTFINRTYNPANMVIASVGNIAFSKLLKIISKYFSFTPFDRHNNIRITFDNYIPKQKIIPKKTHQSHCLVGNVSFSLSDPRRHEMFLLTNILGGPCMKNRLNMALRERNGLVYSVEANCQSYVDTGVFNIYFGAEKNNVDRVLDLIYKELEILKNTKLGVIQLEKAKQQLIGQLAIASDSGEQRMLSMAKSVLVYNKVDEDELINQRIEQISSSAVMDVANQLFDKNQLSVLLYK